MRSSASFLPSLCLCWRAVLLLREKASKKSPRKRGEEGKKESCFWKEKKSFFHLDGGSPRAMERELWVARKEEEFLSRGQRKGRSRQIRAMIDQKKTERGGRHTTTRKQAASRICLDVQAGSSSQSRLLFPGCRAEVQDKRRLGERLRKKDEIVRCKLYWAAGWGGGR